MLHYIVDPPMATVVTGYETENKYRIRNTLGQQIYFANESKQNLTVCAAWVCNLH